MARCHLATEREAVDCALRSLVGNPMTKEEALAMAACPDLEIPAGTVDARRNVERLLVRIPLIQFDNASDFIAAADPRRSACQRGLRVRIDR